jgi:hypothetical protein
MLICMRHYRLALLLAMTAMGSMGAFAAACSSNNNSNFSNDDGGSDATTDGAVDSGKDTGNVVDSGSGDTGDELQGNCEPIQGPCDLVLQNCGGGKECVPAQSGGGYTTVCQTPTGTQHIGKGSACTPPSQANQNPCLPGLECLQSRCSPYCCLQDNTPCGASVPEGLPGQCNLSVTGGDAGVLYYACTYSATCKPFKVLPCPQGSGCYGDQQANFTCSQYAVPNGKPEGSPCQYLNDCVDGTQCLGTGDGGSACTMLCYTGQGNPPFDAGSLQMGPGTGGCSNGKSCTISINGWPTWIGGCK